MRATVIIVALLAIVMGTTASPTPCTMKTIAFGTNRTLHLLAIYPPDLDCLIACDSLTDARARNNCKYHCGASDLAPQAGGRADAAAGRERDPPDWNCVRRCAGLQGQMRYTCLRRCGIDQNS